MENKKVLRIKPNRGVLHFGNPVEEVILTVMHGTGMASGTSWISMELILEAAKTVEAGGYAIENNRLIHLGGRKSLEGPLADELHEYFLNHPAHMEELKKALRQ